MKKPFTSFAQVLEHLDNLGLFHVEMGLGRIENVLAPLGLKRPPFKVVQVLGTNGKGSTSTFLASLGQRHGLKTGLFTSPHFVSPKERIKINGQPASEEAWLEAANIVIAKNGQSLTYFEFLTVLALSIFEKAQVDLAVFEAGLGGAHDATSAIIADLRCYTAIAMDHADLLGPSITAIARDKARAIGNPAPVFSTKQFPRALAELAQTAKAKGARFIEAKTLDPAWQSKLGLNGPHQLKNAGLAITAWRELAPQLGIEKSNPKLEAEALAGAFFPGRLQFIPPKDDRPALLADGAHNPHAMLALVNALKNMPKPCKKITALIFSCLADKDWRSGLRILADCLGRIAPQIAVYVPEIANPRAADPWEIADFLASLGFCSPTALPGPHSLKEALCKAKAADNECILLTGSLYLLSDFYRLEPEWLQCPKDRF